MSFFTMEIVHLFHYFIQPRTVDEIGNCHHSNKATAQCFPHGGVCFIPFGKTKC